MKIKYLAAVGLLAFGLTACDVDQTQEGEMPEVDVSVEEGQMPAYDVDWADIDIRTRTEMVEVPKLRVVMEEEAVEVPYIDMDWPEDSGEAAERVLAVDAVVTREGNLDIKEVYTNGQRLIVLAELELDEDADELSDGETMTLSDQVIVNSPDMDVRYYIIGDRPENGFNSRYTYIRDRNQIGDMMRDGKTIYTRKNS